MTDDPQDTDGPQRSWLDVLSQALLREPQDRDQLVKLLRDAEQRELLDAQALAMIEGVLQVSEMQVRDIMVPRSQMVVIEEGEDLMTFLPSIIQSHHSRLPVMGHHRDNIVGIVHAKDLLQFLFNPQQAFALDQVLRPTIMVPESKRLDVLLKEFRVNHNHMAIVVDEYDGIAGLVTIEDVLEQIVGEIEDEFDINEEDFIKQHDAKRFIVKALTPVEDFNDHFQMDLSDEDFDTIGGHVINAFGYIPKRGESVELAGFTFKILRADKRRVHLLEMRHHETP